MCERAFTCSVPAARVLAHLHCLIIRRWSALTYLRHMLGALS